MGDFFDNTVLFASKHIERVFGVKPKILLGQKKWLYTDDSGILWRVKAHRNPSSRFDTDDEWAEVLAQRSFKGGSVVTFGHEHLHFGTQWFPRQPNWDFEFPMIKSRAGHGQKVAEWVYLSLLARGVEMPSEDKYKVEFSASKFGFSYQFSDEYRVLVTLAHKDNSTRFYYDDDKKIVDSLKKAIRDLRVEVCGEPMHSPDGNLFEYYDIFPDDPVSYEERHGITPDHLRAHRMGL